jgi:hypothetical protein
MTTASSHGSYLPPTGWLDVPEVEKEGPGPLFLLAMVLVGLALRFFMLDSQSLWVDEIMTWEMVRPGVGLDVWYPTLDYIQGPWYQGVLWR